MREMLFFFFRHMNCSSFTVLSKTKIKTRFIIPQPKMLTSAVPSSVFTALMTNCGSLPLLDTFFVQQYQVTTEDSTVFKVWHKNCCSIETMYQWGSHVLKRAITDNLCVKQYCTKYNYVHV